MLEETLEIAVFNLLQRSAPIANKEHTGMRVIGMCARNEGVPTLDFRNQSLPEQEVERTIDGRRSQAPAKAFLHSFEQVVGAKRLSCLAERLQH